MTTPQCSNCFFSFVAPASAGTLANNRGAALVGSRFCNRQAPSADAANPNGWLWPLVADDWWCGEGADTSTGLSYAVLLNGVPGANGAGYGGTSASSLTIAASGSINAIITANLAYTAGARVRFTSTGSGAWMEGVVTSYTQGSGALVFTADKSSGSGSHTDWDVNLAGQPGTNGTDAPQWTITSGDPSGGADGDFWLDNASGRLYEKVTGSWTVKVTLVVM